LAENDWFSVVKVSTVWDSNVSDERLNYFLWNAFQTNTGKLDSFYRNNYYTYYELFDKRRQYEWENTPDENSSQYKYFNAVLKGVEDTMSRMEYNTNRYLESLALHEKYMYRKYEMKHTNQKEEPVLNTHSSGKTVKTDSLARLSKKEFTDVYESVKEYLLSLQTGQGSIEGTYDLKKQIKYYSEMLSKRLQSNITSNAPDSHKQVFIDFKNTIREYE
jgi:hypothetical protein